MVDVVAPPEGASYPGLLRRLQDGPVRPFLALIAGVVGFALVPSLVTQLLLGLGWLARGRPPSFASYVARGTRFELPEGMLATQLGLAALTLVTLGALRSCCGLEGRWVHSVQPGLRWRFLALVAGIALIVLNAGYWLMQGLHRGPAVPQPGFGWFLVVIVLTSPLQAAGEEYLFRGLLLTTLGSLARSPWVGVVASALLFALVHGVQSPALFCDRLAFGLLAGALVVKTGGLEAGIAAHVVNNVLAFTYAGLFGTIADARTMTTVTWTQFAADTTTFALVALGAWMLGRRLGVATTTPTVLRPGRPMR